MYRVVFQIFFKLLDLGFIGAADVFFHCVSLRTLWPLPLVFQLLCTVEDFDVVDGLVLARWSTWWRSYWGDDNETVVDESKMMALAFKLIALNSLPFGVKVEQNLVNSWLFVLFENDDPQQLAFRVGVDENVLEHRPENGRLFQPALVQTLALLVPHLQDELCIRELLHPSVFHFQQDTAQVVCLVVGDVLFELVDAAQVYLVGQNVDEVLDLWEFVLLIVIELFEHPDMLERALQATTGDTVFFFGWCFVPFRSRYHPVGVLLLQGLRSLATFSIL